MNKNTLDTIRTRRVTRYFLERPILREDLETIVEAARWAPSGGNRRLQKFIVVTNRRLIRLIRMMSPGIDRVPAALIVVCTDNQNAEKQGYSQNHPGILIDVGMASENILLAAHALGIGAGPVISFSQAAIRVFLDMPEWLSPDLIICLGYPSDQKRGGNVKPPKPLHWQDLTYWEKYTAEYDKQK